ncbi:MAG: hypothetical protein WC184_09920 [Acidimicrobiia bacterium]
MTPAETQDEPDLVALLSQALHLAGRSGAPEEASRIAAKAWWVLTKSGDPKGAQRINGVMHYLARLHQET